MSPRLGSIDLIFYHERWMQSRFFKTDVNDTYGTYAESGGDVVEMADRNPQYEPTAAKERRPRSDNENEYDYMGENREQSVKKGRTHSENKNRVDDYDYMG